MRHLEMWHIVVIVLCLALMVSAVMYVAHRTSQWLGLVPVASYIIFFIFFLTIVASMGSAWYISGTNPFQHWAVIYGCYAAGVLLTLIFVTILTDLVMLPFGDVKVVWKGVVAYGVTAAVTVFCCVNAMRPAVKEISIPIRGLKEDVRIAQLSDLHLGHFRGAKWLSGVVDKVNDANPDIVVITGDIFESHYNLTEEVVAELTKIKVPIYYVAGNHDKYVNLLRIKDMLKRIGVRVLENEIDHFKELQIAGTDLVEVADVIEGMGIVKERPCIMLRHHPNGVQEAVDYGVNLMLSGHTHGGQLFPVTMINKIAFKYNKGLYMVGNGYIYTSEGAGTTGPPMRFGTRSEIDIIDLKPSGLD